MIRTALIGYGKVAHLHARALQNSALGELVAVGGRNRAKAAAFAEQYGVAGYDDLAAMIRSEGVQAVIVCTPHPAHVESAVLAAELGAHVLVEKPLAASLADCDAMIGAADKAGVKLGVISQRRWYEPAQRVRAAIDAGKLGQPVLATVTMLGWRSKEYYRVGWVAWDVGGRGRRRAGQPSAAPA